MGLSSGGPPGDQMRCAVLTALPPRRSLRGFPAGEGGIGCLCLCSFLLLVNGSGTTMSVPGYSRVGQCVDAVCDEREAAGAYRERSRLYLHSWTWGILGQLPSFDSGAEAMGLVRFLLAVSVVLVHAGPTYGITLINGIVAVQAFYIVSGFYMALILHEKYPATINGAKLFYSNRFLRIFPLYWIILALTVLVCILNLSYPETFPALPALKEWIANWDALNLPSKMFLSLTNVSVFGMDWAYYIRVDNGLFEFVESYWPFSPVAHHFHFVVPAWTLGVELTVYVLAPFLFRRPVWLLIILAAASFTLRAVGFYSGLQVDPWNYRFVPFEIGFFLLGALGYRAYKPSRWWKIGSLRLSHSPQR
jgi:peptidoglycan/LPS O-acetylase OafA/YrhL